MAMTTYPDELADLDSFALLDTEATRCDRHFGRAAQAGGWDAPTGCDGWSVRDILAHLRHSHRYDVACLENDLPGLFAEAAINGVSDLPTYNDWGVRLGREREVGELLEEWRAVDIDVRRRLRARGRGGTLPTMAGEYNTGLQALHLAFEHAVHADDMDAEVDATELSARVVWQARFTRWLLVHEKEGGAEVDVRDGANHVSASCEAATLSDQELVHALTGRLPEARLPSAGLRSALRAFG